MKYDKRKVITICGIIEVPPTKKQQDIEMAQKD